MLFNRHTSTINNTNNTNHTSNTNNKTPNTIKMGLCMMVSMFSMFSTGCSTLQHNTIDPGRTVEAMPVGTSLVRVGASATVYMLPERRTAPAIEMDSYNAQASFEHQVNPRFAMGGSVGVSSGELVEHVLIPFAQSLEKAQAAALIGSIYTHVNPVDSLPHLALRAGIQAGETYSFGAENDPLITDQQRLGYAYGAHGGVYYGFGEETDFVRGSVGLGMEATAFRFRAPQLSGDGHVTTEDAVFLRGLANFAVTGNITPQLSWHTAASVTLGDSLEIRPSIQLNYAF